MEHKKRKMFAAVIVMMLCAVAIVGVGYAYTAQTNNTGNDVTAEYITIVQGGTGAYQFADDVKIKWDTVDYKDGTYKTDFTLNGETVSDAVDGYTLKAAGNPITLKFATTGTVTDRDCYVGTDGFDYDSDVNVFMLVTVGETKTPMKLTETGFKTKVSSDWTGPGKFALGIVSSAYVNATVQMYVGYPTTPGKITVEHELLENPDIANPINGATVKFGVATESEYISTGIAMNETSKSLAEGATFDLNVTFTPSTVLEQTVKWTSSNTDKVTVDNDGVITAVAAGEGITITATDAFNNTATCTVTVTAAPAP